MTEAEKIAACPVKPGMTVIRKSNPKVRGQVRGVFVEYFRPWRVCCRVHWERTTTGGRRLNGNRTMTTVVLADTLREVENAEVTVSAP